jgi:hypothetical protein
MYKILWRCAENSLHVVSIICIILTRSGIWQYIVVKFSRNKFKENTFSSVLCYYMCTDRYTNKLRPIHAFLQCKQLHFYYSIHAWHVVLLRMAYSFREAYSIHLQASTRRQWYQHEASHTDVNTAPPGVKLHSITAVICKAIKAITCYILYFIYF